MDIDKDLDNIGNKRFHAPSITKLFEYMRMGKGIVALGKYTCDKHRVVKK